LGVCGFIQVGRDNGEEVVVREAFCGLELCRGEVKAEEDADGGIILGDLWSAHL